MNLYGFQCEYCKGTVQERLLDREPITLPRGIAILEQVPIGVCDTCGAHYYSAEILKRVEAMLSSTTPPARTIPIPIATYHSATATG